MKYQLRQGVFESNSSSQHSICVTKENKKYNIDEITSNIYIREDGTWHLHSYSMQFGRSPFKCLTKFNEKFLYCVAALCEEYMDDIWIELENIAIKYIPGLKKIIPDTKTECKKKSAANNDSSGLTEEEMESFIEEKSKKFGQDLYYWESKNNDYWHYIYPDMGYAEDYGMLKSFLNKNNVSLENFLTNTQYIVVVDGDEYNIWGSLKESKLINSDYIEYEYPST